MSTKQQFLIDNTDSIQQQAFNTESTLYNCQVAQTTTPAYDIEVHKLNLPTPGHGTYYSEHHCFLEYLEFSEHDLSARYSRGTDHRSIGQLIFIPPGVELEWQWEKGVQNTITCMFEIERMPLLNSYNWRWDNIDLPATFNIQNDYLLTGMRKLGEEARSPGFASELQIENMLTVMGIELHREFIKKRPAISISPGRLTTHQLNLIRDFIYANLNKEVSVTSIASHCILPPRELSEQFKNTLGITLRQFVASARIDKAKALLANQHLMIKQIGYECGFKGSAAFVAAFRKTVGITPAEYRRRCC